MTNPENNPPHSTVESSPRQSVWRKFRWTLVVVVLAVTGISLVALLENRTAPDPPMPADLDRLDPQLKTYLNVRIDDVKEKRRDPERHAALGMAYAANGLWKEAYLAFQNVAALKPSEPLASLYMAIAAHEQGETSRGLEILKTLTARFPNFPQGFYRLGELSLRSGALDQAEAAFKKLNELSPVEWRGYAGLADIELRRGNHERALELARQAVLRDKDARIAYHLMGLAYRALGQTAEAEDALARGLNAEHYPMEDRWSQTAFQHMKLLPDQFELARNMAARGEAVQAVRLLEEAYVYHPKDASVMEHLALAYNTAGAPEKARKLMKTLLESEPRRVQANMILTASALALGTTDEAIRHADIAIELAPDFAAGYIAKANVLLALERDQEAVRLLRKAIELDPQNPALRLEAGDVCFFNLRQPQEALELYQQAGSVQRGFLPAYLRIAELQLHLKNPEAARTALLAAKKIAPSDPAVSMLENRLRQTEQGAKQNGPGTPQ